ncbi:ABC transporter permease [Clostridium zeae]|uniref:ABC transporter permease n=1 Tax=Clostridium zeae TaxID=2759022 RepID=A0ABQ1EH41_9CLOT|nr:HlyD family secretion protein [Clostridium zeae]GFZ34047.1 ABC transporter permease [Clostridium zeae]
MKKRLLIIAILMSISILMLNECDSKKSVTKSESNYSIYTITAPQNVYLDGEVRYVQQQNFYLDSTKGSLDKISVSNNQDVKKGQNLYTYKNDQRIQEYQTYIDQLKTLQDEESKLKKQVGITDKSQTDDSANGKVVELQSQINQNYQQQTNLKQQINSVKDARYIVVTAPFDGNVQISPDSNKCILTITNKTMEVVSNVSEKDILKLKIGQSIDINIYGTNEETKGTINSISNTPIESAVQTSTDSGASGVQGASNSNISHYSVHIGIDMQKDLYQGFHIQGITIAENQVPRIPVSAIVNDNNNTYVWLVDNNKLSKANIEYESYNKAYAKIKSGLKFGDKVIANPTSSIKEGDNVDATTIRN